MAGQLLYTFDMFSQAKYNYSMGQIWPAGLSLTLVVFVTCMSKNQKDNIEPAVIIKRKGFSMSPIAL